MRTWNLQIASQGNKTIFAADERDERWWGRGRGCTERGKNAIAWLEKVAVKVMVAGTTRFGEFYAC